MSTSKGKRARTDSGSSDRDEPAAQRPRLRPSDDDLKEFAQANPSIALCIRELSKELQDVSEDDMQLAVSYLMASLSSTAHSHIAKALEAGVDGGSVDLTLDEQEGSKAPPPTDSAISIESVLSLLRPNTLNCVSEMKQQFDSATPFRWASMPLFTDEFVGALQNELVHEGFYEKSCDLFDLFQTDDLRNCPAECVSQLRRLLYSPEFTGLISSITGIPLRTDVVDMHGAVYRKTSHLLCHDDELEGRRIAYIYYLVDSDFTEGDGGLLELFPADDAGRPSTENTVSVSPQRNRFVFFEVSPISYHQVKEVLTDKVRLAISGWFYGESITRDGYPPDPAGTHIPLSPPSPTPPSHPLTALINADYLKGDIQSGIAEHFADTSSVVLSDFLLPEVYSEFVAAVEAGQYTRVGPINKRNYGRLESSSVQSPILELFNSQVFTDFLATVTGVTLVERSVEVRAFACGDYTLLRDDCFNEPYRLDVIFSCPTPGAKEWSADAGGTVSYVAKGVSEPIATLDYLENTLAVVFREPGVAPFVKYVSSLAEGTRRDVCYVASVDVDSDSGSGSESESGGEGPANASD